MIKLQRQISLKIVKKERGKSLNGKTNKTGKLK